MMERGKISRTHGDPRADRPGDNGHNRSRRRQGRRRDMGRRAYGSDSPEVALVSGVTRDQRWVGWSGRQGMGAHHG